MPRLECNKLFEGCEGVVEADNVDDVMAQAASHAAAVHGLSELDDATAEAVRNAIDEKQ